MAGKVAVVTGGNKGVGFGIVRGLCKQFEGDVYLTARDEGRGQAAVQDLNKEGLKPKFHQLDINNHSSIEALKQHLLDTYGGLDLLVNNAAIAYKNASPAPFSEQADVSCKTNFWSTLDCCRVLFPILRPHSRVVNVSSMASTMSLASCSDAKKTLILGAKSIQDVENFMTQFVVDAKAGTHQANGWPNTAYGISKLGVTAMSIIQQKDIQCDPREDIIINACCPGYVDTDMTSHKGHLTIDQGAETPLYLAMLPPGTTSPKGNFVQKKKITPWQ